MTKAADNFAMLREAVGPDGDIGIDFHGAISPATAKLLIKAIEPYQPMFVEEPVNCQYVDAMADIARGTHLPIATGERIFTKWGFREILEKQAAVILQPDLCHAGGITECRLIAGMAEAYYASIAPHNPLGPISLAAGLQLAASIPNFMCQEQVSLGEGYLKTPFVVKDGYVDLPTEPGPGHRARRGADGRQDRPRLDGTRRPTTRKTGRSSTGSAYGIFGAFRSTPPWCRVTWLTLPSSPLAKVSWASTAFRKNLVSDSAKTSSLFWPVAWVISWLPSSVTVRMKSGPI